MESFNPPLRTLMGPGPSDVHPRVLAAMARPTIGHLDPAFQQFMETVKDGLRYAFRTKNAMTIPISAPGSAGMETCFVNLVEPGDKVIVAENGSFGGRMRENVTRIGGEAIVLDFEWGKPVDPEVVENAFKQHGDAKLFAFVHAETSTGVKSDATTLCHLAQDYGMLTIVDAVTSVAGTPVEVDIWGADGVYTGTQKCLSCPPGISPVTFSNKAVEVIKSRKTPVQSWFLDLNLVMAYWDGEGGRTYHHTAPVNALYALHEGLVMLREETIERSWARHATMHQALRAGVEAMGLSFLVDEPYRLPQLNTVRVPEGIDEAAIRGYVLDRFNLEIGAGLGGLAGKVWRIGLMGQSAQIDRVTLCLTALENALQAHQAPINTGVAVDAALKVIDEG